MVGPTDGNEHTDDSDHPDLANAAGEMRAEWRAEQDAATADAAAQWRHSRGIVDWLRERMHAGDRIAVLVATQEFIGLVDEVGSDLVALRAPFGRVEIHVCAGVPLSFSIVEHARAGGTRATATRGFRDVLLARHAQTGVRVGTVQYPEGIEGTLSVGSDLVSVAISDGAETIIPIDHIAWVALNRV